MTEDFEGVTTPKNALTIPHSPLLQTELDCNLVKSQSKSFVETI